MVASLGLGDGLVDFSSIGDPINITNTVSNSDDTFSSYYSGTNSTLATNPNSVGIEVSAVSTPTNSTGIVGLILVGTVLVLLARK